MEGIEFQAVGPRKESRHGARLREAHFEDYGQIAALESRFGLHIKPYNEWVRLWRGNPQFRELKNGWPIGWVLESGDHEIVGSMGNIPLAYELGGKRILTTSGRSWVAEPEYRSASLLLLDRLIRQRHVDLYLNNTVSKNSVAAVTALGCTPVPAGIWDEATYWVTNYRDFFQNLARTKNYSLRAPFSFPQSWDGTWNRWKALRVRFAKPLGYALSAVAYLKEAGRTASFADKNVAVEACPRFDDRFDTFWEDLRRRNPEVLLAVRTREVLDWHFRQALNEGRLWIVTVVDGRRILAYGIFDKTAHLKSGFGKAQLIDFQSLEPGVSLLRPVLAWALRKCRSEGIHTLEHTGRWMHNEEFFQASAPYRIKLSVWSYFYRTTNPELKAVLEDQRTWAPTLFDGDATL